jgi:hypothetical protein
MGEQSYSIYEPATVRHDIIDRAEDLVFVKDGFAFWAMAMPVIWLIYHRLWWGLAGFLVALGVLQGLAWLAGVDSESGTGLVSMGLSLAFGFLANDIRRRTLEHKRYALVGTVTGASQLDCERRFFDSWEPLAAEVAINEGGMR